MKKSILFLIFVLTTCLYSTIINVPIDEPTIQAGIDAAADTDTVLVAEGTYFENIDFLGKAVTVASNFIIDGDEAHIENTIINGSQSTDPDFGSCAMFMSYEGNDSVLAGFTLTEGTGTFYENYGTMGGGIMCMCSSPKIVSNIITNNNATLSGGIDCSSNSSAIILNNVISYNTATGNMGGLTLYDSNANVEGNIIAYNTAQEGAGGVAIQGCSPILVNNLIVYNSAAFGGGLVFWNSESEIINCTISGNISTGNGGGIYCHYYSHLDLVNTIMWNNSPQEIYVNTGSIGATYSDIQGGWGGEGNINADPLFVGTGDHPFMLQDLSPCVNTGIEDTTGLNLPEFDFAGNDRIYGGRIDMGAYEWQGTQINDDELSIVNYKLNNFPNPFNPETTIRYQLPNNGKVELAIYNLKGQKVKQLVNDQLLVGQHSVVWNGRDSNDKRISSGMYFYKMKTDNHEETKKMILLK